MSSVVQVQERSIMSRLEQFFAQTPWEIVSDKIHGPPEGLCDEGRGLLYDTAFNPSDHRFRLHMKNKCGCKKGFIKQLYKVTN